jgi:hypothetical protein
LGLAQCWSQSTPAVQAAGNAATAAFLANVDHKVYTPATRGLRSLRAVMRNAKAEEAFPELGGIRIVLYWKVPDRRRVRFETLGGKVVRNSSLDFFLNDGIDMLGYVVPTPFAMRRAEAVPSIQAQGHPQLKILPEPWDIVQEPRIFTFDKDYLPVQSQTAMPGMFSHTDIMEYEFRGGQALLRRVNRTSTTDMGGSNSVIRLHYTTVDRFWLPSQITVEQPTTIFLFEQYEVNRGLDDRIFTQ